MQAGRRRQADGDGAARHDEGQRLPRHVPRQAAGPLPRRRDGEGGRQETAARRPSASACDRSWRRAASHTALMRLWLAASCCLGWRAGGPSRRSSAIPSPSRRKGYTVIAHGVKCSVRAQVGQALPQGRRRTRSGWKCSPPSSGTNVQVNCQGRDEAARRPAVPLLLRHQAVRRCALAAVALSVARRHARRRASRATHRRWCRSRSTPTTRRRSTSSRATSSSGTGTGRTPTTASRPTRGRARGSTRACRRSRARRSPTSSRKAGTYTYHCSRAPDDARDGRGRAGAGGGRSAPRSVARAGLGAARRFAIARFRISEDAP